MKTPCPLRGLQAPWISISGIALAIAATRAAPKAKAATRHDSPARPSRRTEEGEIYTVGRRGLVTEVTSAKKMTIWIKKLVDAKKISDYK
jgi:hypothetical protein